MLFDYVMDHNAHVVPVGARSPRQVKVPVRHVIEIPEAAADDVTLAAEGRRVTGYDFITPGNRQELLQASIDADTRPKRWYLHNGALYAGAVWGGQCSIAGFEGELARRGGLRAALRGEILAGGRGDVREWHWDDRAEREADERAFAAHHLVAGGNVLARSVGPMWQISSRDNDYVMLELVANFSLLHVGLKDTYCQANFAEAKETAEAMARKDGRDFLLAGRVEVFGAGVPELDIPALYLMSRIHLGLREIVKSAPYIPTRLVREYCDLRDTADAIAPVWAIQENGTAADFRRSRELVDLGRAVSGLGDAVGPDAAKDLCDARKALSHALRKVATEPAPRSHTEIPADNPPRIG